MSSFCVFRGALNFSLLLQLFENPWIQLGDLCVPWTIGELINTGDSCRAQFLPLALSNICLEPVIATASSKHPSSKHGGLIPRPRKKQRSKHGWIGLKSAGFSTQACGFITMPITKNQRCGACRNSTPHARTVHQGFVPAIFR